MGPLLPAQGSERLAAINELHRALAEEFVNQGHRERIDSYLSQGPEFWTVEGERAWLHGIIDAAYEEALAFLRLWHTDNGEV